MDFEHAFTINGNLRHSLQIAPRVNLIQPKQPFHSRYSEKNQMPSNGKRRWHIAQFVFSKRLCNQEPRINP
jgi:hypothetical protein